MGDIRCLVTVD